MKKKVKIILITSMIIVAIVISIIPSYAYAPNYINLTIVDGTNENNSFTFNIYNEWGNIGYIVYTYNLDGYLTISVAPSINDLDGSSTVYKMWLPSYRYAEIDTYAAGDDEFIGTIGYTPNGNVTTLEGALQPDAQHQNVNITIEIKGDQLYTSEQYQTYGTQRYNAGIDRVRNYPGQYNLYTQEQYTEYGESEYIRGMRNVGKTNQEYNDYGNSEFQRGYATGLQAAEAAEKAKGIINVILSNILNTTITLGNSLSIFGLTLLSVVISMAIIYIVYLLFKVVRG